MLDDLFRDGEPGPGKAARNRGQAPARAPDPVQRHGGRKTIRLASGVASVAMWQCLNVQWG
jgi:hypothetical protein